MNGRPGWLVGLDVNLSDRPKWSIDLSDWFSNSHETLQYTGNRMVHFPSERFIVNVHFFTEILFIFINKEGRN